jgi:hypothetical protein
MAAKVVARTSQNAKGPKVCIAWPAASGPAMAPSPKVKISPPDAAGMSSVDRKSLV